MPKAVEYPPGTKQKAIDLYLSGLSFRRVASVLSVPTHAVMKWLKERNIEGRETYQTEDDLEALRAQAKALYEDYYSLADVGAIVNRSPSTVKKWLVKDGVKMRKPGDRSKLITVPLTPELEKMPREQRKNFCRGAIDNALENSNPPV